MFNTNVMGMIHLVCSHLLTVDYGNLTHIRCKDTNLRPS